MRSSPSTKARSAGRSFVLSSSSTRTCEPARYGGDEIPRRNHIRAGRSDPLVVGDAGRRNLGPRTGISESAPVQGRSAARRGPRWLRWSLLEAIERMTPWMHGSAMTHITRRVLEEVRVPVPPQDVQGRIADYLDTETARIDTLIAKNEHAAALVEERLRGTSNGDGRRKAGPVGMAARTAASTSTGLVVLRRWRPQYKSQLVKDVNAERADDPEAADLGSNGRGPVRA